MPLDKRSVAKRLAEMHFESEPNLKQVFLLDPLGDDADDEPIKLLEIVDGSLAQGVYPISFAPNASKGLPYRFVVVELAPEEWAELQGAAYIPFRGKRWTVREELMPASMAA